MKMQEFIHEPPFECEISPKLIEDLYVEITKLVPDIDVSEVPDSLESIKFTYHADEEQHISIDAHIAPSEWGSGEREFNSYALTIHESHAPFADFLDEMREKGLYSEELEEALDYYPLMSREIGVVISPGLDVSFWKAGTELKFAIETDEGDIIPGLTGIDEIPDDERDGDDEGVFGDEIGLTLNTRDLAYIYWVLEKIEPGYSVTTGS